MCSKNLEGKFKSKNSKRTISASGGFRPLQMLSKSDIEQCVSENVVHGRRVVVRSHIGWREEQSIL